jgi:hypothetical protein
MTRSHELRQPARALTSTDCDHGCRWLVASCSLRESGLISALEAHGQDLRSVQTWSVDGGIAQLCCPASGRTAAALHVAGPGTCTLKVWRLETDAASSVSCDHGESGQPRCIASARGAQGALISCTSDATHLWSLDDGRAQVLMPVTLPLIARSVHCDPHIVAADVVWTHCERAVDLWYACAATDDVPS